MSFEKWNIYNKKSENSDLLKEKVVEQSEKKKLIESSEKRGENYLSKQKSSLMEKIGNILEIAKPHSLKELVLKVTGAFNIFMGLRMSEIAFLHPESMNIMGRPLDSEAEFAAKALSILTTMLGVTVFANGIYDAIEYVRKNKEESRVQNIDVNKKQ